jgi:hypothetical protein
MNKSRVFIPVRRRPWIEARSRWSVSHVHVQMARKQGMNPNKLGGLANRRQGRGSCPCPISSPAYIKRIGKMPNVVKTIEEVAMAEMGREARTLQGRRHERSGLIIRSAR